MKARRLAFLTLATLCAVPAIALGQAQGADPVECRKPPPWGFYGTAGYTSGSTGEGSQDTLSGYLRGAGWSLGCGWKMGAWSPALNLQDTIYERPGGATPTDALGEYLSASLLQHNSCGGRMTFSVQGTIGYSRSNLVGKPSSDTKYLGGNLTDEYRLSRPGQWEVSVYGSVGKKWPSGKAPSWSGFLGLRLRFKAPP
jgi:hypothetical protein